MRDNNLFQAEEVRRTIFSLPEVVQHALDTYRKEDAENTNEIAMLYLD